MTKSTGGDTGTTTGATGGAVDCATVEFGCVEVASGEPITIGTLLSITRRHRVTRPGQPGRRELAIDYLDGDARRHAVGSCSATTSSFHNEDDLCSAEGGQAGGTALAAIHRSWP